MPDTTPDILATPITEMDHRDNALKPVLLLIGFVPWKTFMAQWFPDHRVVRCRLRRAGIIDFIKFLPFLIRDKRSMVCVWSYKEPWIVSELCRRFSIPIIRVEDGFLRSVQLGAMRVPPLSLCFAEKALYFDATEESELERIIETYDFESDPELVERARRGIQALISSRLSKYNLGESVDIEKIYGPKTRERILVVGQIEGDMSMVKGMTRPMTNNELVRAVVAENPGAQVIYKPHPEVLRGIRKKPRQTDPKQVGDICLVIEQDVALADAFQTIDRVYTMTSLSGFEAVIRGIPVTCFGMPFYAGWGITEDREKRQRRTQRRRVEEVFAAAYILYAKYKDPRDGTDLTLEQAIELLKSMRDEGGASPDAAASRFQPKQPGN